MVVTLLTSAGIGALLGYLAQLPFFLGVFFFMLLGLVPGAVLFRYADPIRPVPGRHLLAGSISILIVVWVLASYVEYLSLQQRVAVKVRNTITGGFPDGYRRDILNDHVADLVREDLRKRYGSEGMVGYVKWAADSGRIEIPAGTIRLPSVNGGADRQPVELSLPKPAIYRLPQPALLWCIRVGLSFVLLIFALILQIVPLRKPDSTQNAEPDDESALDQTPSPDEADPPTP